MRVSAAKRTRLTVDPFLYHTLLGATVVVASAAVVAPAVGIAALGAAGFTTSGVAAGMSIDTTRVHREAEPLMPTFLGSIAAGAQSLIYGPLTCGVFSALQAAGATAVMPGAASLVAGTAGLVAGAGTMIAGSW